MKILTPFLIYTKLHRGGRLLRLARALAVARIGHSSDPPVYIGGGERLHLGWIAGYQFGAAPHTVEVHLDVPSLLGHHGVQLWEQLGLPSSDDGAAAISFEKLC